MSKSTGVVVVALSVFASATAPFCVAHGKEKDPEPPGKLIGVWVATRGELPRGSTIEFRKKGKLTITVRPPGMKAVPIEGTYKTAGKKIDLVTFDANKEQSKEVITIKSLTAKRLVLVAEKGQEAEFAKK